MAHYRRGRRPKATPAQDEKVGVVMREFNRGTLKSSGGQRVTNPAQAKAIAMSEAGLSYRDRRNRARRKRGRLW